MELFKSFHRVLPLRAAIGWLLVGLFFIGVSLLYFTRPHELIAVEARIVEITEDYDVIEQRTVLTVYIDYEAEGVLYTHAQSPSSSSGMEIGDVITVFYDAEDPTLLSSTDSGLIVYVCLALGVLSALGGGISVVRSIQERRAG